MTISLSILINQAINAGVPPTTLVLLLLFPLVATLVAAARHLIGFRGFGIYIPAVIAVALTATGFTVGLLLFGLILIVGTYSAIFLKRFHLQYLPRMALILWFVSLSVLVAMLASPHLYLHQLTNLNIFPVLILILLAENFQEVRLGKSEREAFEMTMETLILSVMGALIMSLKLVQDFALHYPEILLFGTAAINILVGKYTGLRLKEYQKYKKLLK